MLQKGRKSAASMKTAPITQEISYLSPPAGMSSDQLSEWEDMVRKLPKDWFKREHQGLLEAYCSHVCRHRFLKCQLDQMEADGLPDDMKRYEALSRAVERESKSMLAYARSMRLTHQAQYDTQKAARKNNVTSNAKRPWER